MHCLGNARTGRENDALKVYSETLQYWGRLQQEGKLESFEVVVLGPTGGVCDRLPLGAGHRAADRLGPSYRGVLAANQPCATHRRSRPGRRCFR